jgi:PKD domain
MKRSSLDVTPGGSVVVTGRSTGGVTSYDFATIVYNTDGSTRWLERYNSSVNGSDQPSDVVFGPDEVVYVGEFESTAIDTDFSLVKYANDGTLLWNRTYNGPSDKWDSIKRIQLDSAGNIIVTGYEQQSNFYSDFATIKYDADGNQLWLQHLNLVANNDEIPWTIALGANDAIYVGGESDQKFALVKYSAGGAEEWHVTYDNPGNLFDSVQSVAAGPSNRVVVTGPYPILTASYSEGSVNQPPVAVLTADTLSGTAPLTVNFSSAGSSDPDGNIVSYQWDFGDQTSSNQANPTHIFNTAGSYNVVLTVFDDGGLSAQDSDVVVVTDDSVLFYDDFASGNISSWQQLRGNWNVVNQALVGQHIRKAEILSPFAGCGNCSVEADLQLLTANANASMLGWYVDKKNYVEVILMGEKGRVVLKQRSGGDVVLKSKAAVSLNSGVYHLKVAFDGAAFSVFLNGNVLFSAATATSPFGKFGFRLKGSSAANALVAFDNVLIQ